MLVELYLQAGRREDGLRLVDELFEVVEAKNERNYEPELHRLRGELLLHGHEDDASLRAEAERCIRRALELAERQGARALCLRASTSLARYFPESDGLQHA